MALVVRETFLRPRAKSGDELARAIAASRELSPMVEAPWCDHGGRVHAGADRRVADGVAHQGRDGRRDQRRRPRDAALRHAGRVAQSWSIPAVPAATARDVQHLDDGRLGRGGRRRARREARQSRDVWSGGRGRRARGARCPARPRPDGIVRCLDRAGHRLPFRATFHPAMRHRDGTARARGSDDLQLARAALESRRGEAAGFGSVWRGLGRAARRAL